jgi:hypothetical protein
MAVLIEELVHGNYVHMYLVLITSKTLVVLLVTSLRLGYECSMTSFMMSPSFSMLIVLTWRVQARILRILHSPPCSMYAGHELSIEPCTEPIVKPTTPLLSHEHSHI